jgi:hypothetical protein
MIIENFKIHHLTRDQFKFVQEIIFKNNCSWVGSHTTNIKEHSDSNDISIVVNNLEARSGSDIVQGIFDQLRGEEITFEQFKELYFINIPKFTKQQMFDFAEFYANNSDTILNDELLKQFLNP